MKHSYSGFTLIELMIVVAIIGILASIAIPNYQSFIARSQASESIIMLDTAHVMVEEQTSITGSFPTNRISLLNLEVNLLGTYGSITGVSNVNTDTGSIVYKLSPIGVQNSIKSKSIWLNRASITGKWSCSSNLPSKYSPRGCNFSNSVPTGL